MSEDWIPSFEPGSNAGLVAGYELEGELPAGITFDRLSGKLAGVPTTLLVGSDISIHSINSLGRSSPFVVHISATSDLSELLMLDHPDYAPAILREFPTIHALKAWYLQLLDTDRDATLNELLKDDVKVASVARRGILKGMLVRAIQADKIGRAHV